MDFIPTCMPLLKKLVRSILFFFSAGRSGANALGAEIFDCRHLDRLQQWRFDQPAVEMWTDSSYLMAPGVNAVLLSQIYQMKIGGNIYCDGARMGEIIFISAMAYPDSQNPLLLTTDKATQFSIIVDAVVSSSAEFDSHRWEVGNYQTKRRISVVACHCEDRRTKMVVDLPPI